MAASYADTRFPGAGLFEELTARALADQVRAAQRYRDLLHQVAAGEVDIATVRAEFDRLVTAQSADLVRDLTALGARYYQSMLDLNRAYVDRLFDELASTARVAPAAAVEDVAPGPGHGAGAEAVELRVRGRPGDVVETGFVVENKRDEPADVVFLLSEFTGGGGEPFRAPLELDPPRFRLGPNEERAVILRLPLDPVLFGADGRYDAELLVRGRDDQLLRLVVDVDQ